MEIVYEGESLIYGVFGNLLLAAAFSFALLSFFSFLISIKNPLDVAWKKIARTSFILHSVSVIVIFALLYFLISGRYYEYYYVWQHSSDNLPAQYLFACIWEGQEGSFILWAFWHCILGLFILKQNNEWSAPVIMVVSIVQAFILSMILGVFVGDLKIGSNPFTLLREHPDMANLPFVQLPDYLNRIEDGRGLNPLLQNYWMVIHPPMLFLGFASTLIPFAFAMAALVTKKYTEWVKPALSFTLFAVLSLGTGLLMGAAWAYEALSFGGFWAWDPVENASLVPWITLVAGLHVMFINKSRQKAFAASIILLSASFILVLYSTFLTRSGILGDSSVHSFTDLGLMGQLLFFLIAFIVIAATLIIYHIKKIPGVKEEDPILSREFWLYLGMLILLVSAIQISFSTSIPVINKVFGTNMAPPVEVEAHYNSWQVPIASLILIMMCIAIYLRFKKDDKKRFFKSISLSFFLSLIISIALGIYFVFSTVPMYLLLFASVFAIIANFIYFINKLKAKFKISGATISHIGFALIMLGSLIANAKKDVISENVLNVDLGKDFPNNENIMIRKGDTLSMGSYYVTYTGQRKEGVNVFFTIDYFRYNYERSTLSKVFTLEPFVQLNERMGNVAEPATKHFINYDLYTHVTYAELDKGDDEKDEDFTKMEEVKLSIGDTLSTSRHLLVLSHLNSTQDKESLGLADNDLAVEASFYVIDQFGKSKEMKPMLIIKNNTLLSKTEELDEEGIRIKFLNILPKENQLVFNIQERKSNKRDFIIMKAVLFPYMSLVWAGSFVLVFGLIISIRNRMSSK
ncbi:MAG TPA: cytochrome c biogenesis protein CcsA [Bacteroidia bacterium]|nr:cytochrome c biogenesis protein CcsA [Bacteroidia bacterium]HNT81053.1 cytochrome c biogenesis protein CcsA [Bacteroidia bacterium]